MAEVKQWITINGQHIPIMDGESKDQAVNRYIAEKNEDTKEKQIARAKEQADKLNMNGKGGLSAISTQKEIENYYKNQYGISIDKSYFEHGNSPKMLVESSKVLDGLYSELGLKDKLENVNVTATDFSKDFADSRFANAKAVSVKDFSGRIMVNDNVFNDYDKYNAEYIASGKYPKNTDLSNVLAHEIGHKIEYLLAKQNGVQEIDLPSHATARAIVESSYNELPKGLFDSMQKAREDISKYGGETFEILDGVNIPLYEETFAEAVSDYARNGNNASELSRQIIKNIKSLLRG